MRVAIVTTVLFCSALQPATTHADSVSSMTVANNLGTIIASEKICGLEFDQSAIERFIEKNVSANDLEFASTLNMMVSGTSYQLRDMSASQMTAHCAQVKRAAKASGFIK